MARTFRTDYGDGAREFLPERHKASWRLCRQEASELSL
jgi:hypothetical protein